MPRIKDLSNYTGALNRSDIYFVVDGNSFSRGMSLSGQQVYTMCKGVDGKNIELRATASFIQWRQEGDTSWANLISVSDLKGADGKELEIRVNSGYIQTRLTGGTWASLIAVSDLKGDKGDPADNPAFSFVVSALAWDATPTANITGTYPNLTVNLGIPRGKDAVSPAFAFNISALEWNAAPTASVTGTYPDLTVNLGIPKGKDADSPIFTVNATKGDPGSNPEASITGIYPNLDLAFKIPEGLRGEQGKPLIVLANGNYGNWDEQSADYVDSGVAASATVDIENVVVNFTESATRETLNTGEKIPALFGKIKKWFSDLGALAWKSRVDYQNDIDNLPTLVTSTDINNAVNTHDTSGEAHGDIRTSIEDKVSKVSGKGLSTEDYTTEEKQKLAGLEGSKFKGEYTSLDELEAAWPTADIGSYAFVDAGVGSDTQKYIWDSTDVKWIISGSTGDETPSTIKEKYESNPDTNAFTDAEKAKVDSIDEDISTAIEAHDEDENAHKILFDAMKAVNVSTTLIPANWVQSGNRWYYNVLDSRINSECTVLFAPAHAYEDVYVDTGIHSFGVTTNGYLQIYARNEPTVGIVLNLTILK